jgi:hypothetical protein
MIGEFNIFWAITIVVSLGIIVGFAFFARWCGYSPAVGHKELDTLHVGMTAEEVAALLGMPREKRGGDNNSEFWVYGARWKRHVLVTEFNGDRRLKNFVHGVPSPRRANRLSED